MEFSSEAAGRVAGFCAKRENKSTERNTIRGGVFIQHSLRKCSHCSRRAATGCLASRDRGQHDEWFFPRCNRLGQRCIRRFVREVFLTGEETQERAPLQRAVIADLTTPHSIFSLHSPDTR